MQRFDIEVSGADAAELATLLKVPSLGRETFGWRGLLGAAANLRRLRLRQLQEELGLEVDIRMTVVASD